MDKDINRVKVIEYLEQFIRVLNEELDKLPDESFKGGKR